MNNSEIIITQLAGSDIVRYSIDLFDNIPIEINKSIFDIQNIQDRKSEFTKTITVPGSNNNNDIFSNIFNISRSVINTTVENFAPDFNPNLKANCVVYKNGIVQIVGYLQLTDIRIIDDYQIEYDVVIIGRTANLFQDIADLKMNELDLSQYNHTWSKINIENSWSAPIGSGYYYGLIDYGKSTTKKFYVDQMYPQIYLKTIIDAIFSDAGYRYDSDFFETDRFKRLVIPYSGKALRLTDAQINDRKFISNRTTDSTPTLLNPFNSPNVLPFNNIVQDTDPPSYDATNYKLVINKSAMYSFSANVVVDIINPNAFDCFIPAVTVIIAKYDGATLNYILRKQELASYTITALSTVTITVPVSCVMQSFAIGNEVSILLEYANTANPDGILFSLKSGSTFTNTPYSLTQEGDTIDLASCLPSDINQTDFLSSVFKTFNLYVEPDSLDDKKLIIEPRDDFYLNTIVDLTNQIDVSRGVTIKPLGALHYKSYDYSFDSDTDVVNTIHTDKYTDPYGIYKHKVENDFVKEIYEQKVIFAPTPLLQRTSTPNILSSIVFKDSNGSRVDSPSKMRLLQINEAVAFPGEWTLSERGIFGLKTNYTIYPYVGHLDNPADPEFDLNFGVPREVYYTATKYTNNNLFNVYHRKGIIELTDKDSKIVEYYIKMSELGVSQLSFRYYYFIDKQYYRLYEVNYTSNNEEPVKLTFLKMPVAPDFVGESVEINGGSEEIGNEDSPVLDDPPPRNGNQYDKYQDIFVQGEDNNAQGDVLMVNSYGNQIYGSGITVLGGYGNNLANANSVYLNASGYTSMRDGEVVINNIDQAIGKVINLSVYDVSGIDVYPIEVLPVVPGFLTELTNAYLTIWFGENTPVSYDAGTFKIRYGSSTLIASFDSSITTQVVSKKVTCVINAHPLFESDSLELFTDLPLGSSGTGSIILELHYKLHRIII